MIEVRIDFWTYAQTHNIPNLVVTTNGIVKNNGELVMGRGIALQFAQKFPCLPQELGQLVENTGNQVYYLHQRLWGNGERVIVFSLPTKHHWKDPSDIKLIEQGLIQLKNLHEHMFPGKFIMTRPGCGNGGLNWENQVKPLCKQYLNDDFVIVY